MSERGKGHSLNVGGNIDNSGQLIIGNDNQVSIYYGDAQTPVVDYLKDLPELPSDIDYPIDPYIGLRWFSRAEAHIFYGRSREIKELIEFVQDENSRSIALFYGQSGVGKSSILHAGLTPRLETLNWRVIYERRRQNQHSVSLISQRLDDLPLDQSVIIIFDQLEEIFTHPHETLSDEAVQLAQLIQQTKDRANIKWLLSFRKEYLAEFETHFRGANLAFRSIFVPPLQQSNMVEAVEGASIYGDYGLKIEKGLPQLIAADISRDRDSNMAPALQILLERLWRAARGEWKDEQVKSQLENINFQSSRSQPHFTIELYHTLMEERGLLMQDFLEAQLETIKTEKKDWVTSGLSWDVLQYCTTSVVTSAERTWSALQIRYAHIPDLAALTNTMQQKRLLSDNKHEQDEKRHLRLTHDSLAPLVVQAYNHSNAVGQRARRILENQIQHRKGSFLSRNDLRTVKAGQHGMRVWTAAEEQLVQRSEAQQRKQKWIQIATIAGFLILTGVIAFAIREISSSNKFEQAQQLEDEADQMDDPNKKLALLSKSLQIDDSDPNRREKYYKTYREHLFYEEVLHIPDLYETAFSPKGDFVTVATKTGEATTLQQYRLNAEQKSMELLHTFSAPPAADIQAIAYSGNGQRIVAGGNDHTLHVWDKEGRKLFNHSFGKQNIEELAVSYKGDVVMFHLFGEEELIVFDVEAGEERERIEIAPLKNVAMRLIIHASGTHFFEIYEKRNGSDWVGQPKYYDIENDLLVVDNTLYRELSGQTNFGEPYQERIATSLNHPSDLQFPVPTINLKLTVDSSYVWTVGQNGTFHLRRIPHLPLLHKIPYPTSCYPNQITTTTDGQYWQAYIGTLDVGIWAWRSDAPDSINLLPYVQQTRIEHLVAHNNTLIVADRINDLYFYDINIEKQINKIAKAHDETITDMALSPSGDYLVTCGQDKTVKVWHVATAQVVQIWTYDSPMIDISFDLKNNTLLLLNRDGQLRIAEITADKCTITDSLMLDLVEDIEQAQLLVDGETMMLSSYKESFIINTDATLQRTISKDILSDNLQLNRYWTSNYPYLATFGYETSHLFDAEGNCYFKWENPPAVNFEINFIQALHEDKLLITEENTLEIRAITHSIPEKYSLPFSVKN